MKLSDSLTVESGEKETAEPVRELNSIRVRGIRKNLGVK